MLVPAPKTSTPWMESLESLLSAHAMLQRLIKVAPKSDLDYNWAVDEAVTKHATPYAWSAEAVQATLAASGSIPLDTPMNSWNLDSNAAWWRFDMPLPYQTINFCSGKAGHTDATHVGIRALSFGWIYARPPRRRYPAGTDIRIVERALREGPPPERLLMVTAWLDDICAEYHIIPSQTMVWPEGETLAGLLTSVRAAHRDLYGPGGRREKEPQVGEPIYMAAAEGIARLILAGLAWLNQKIILESDGHIERHRRKAFARQTGQSLDAIKVVSLRRQERPRAPQEPIAEGEKRRTLSCQFTVDGFFRNQACGPAFSERRLTWVHPFIKGPAGAPLRVPKHKVYRVDR